MRTDTNECKMGELKTLISRPTAYLAFSQSSKKKTDFASFPVVVEDRVECDVICAFTFDFVECRKT